MRAQLAGCVALALAVAGCSGGGERDLASDGPLLDGQSLAGWRVLSGEWTVEEGALVGVGSRARIVCEGRCPPSYRLRFEIAPQGSPEVSWAVAAPLGAGHVLSKGLVHFAGGPEDWGDAWQQVEMLVGPEGVASYRLRGLRERRSGETRQGSASFSDAALAHARWKAGCRFYKRPDGLMVLAPPPESWDPQSMGFQQATERGGTCMEGRHRGVALVVPCTMWDGREAPEGAGARFRNVVVEPVE